jgi:hypothetical protein
MAISKCYQLEELRLDGCPQLGECVHYTSLAARFGFHSLKVQCKLCSISRYVRCDQNISGLIVRCDSTGFVC